MSVTRKLKLGSVLLGAEAANNFLQLNQIPLLQLLGLPLSVASLVAAISGPASSLVIFCIGWLADRGPSPQHRKLAATLLVSGIQLFGMSCILTADLLHLNYLLDNAHTYFSPVANVTDLADCGNQTGSRVMEDVGQSGIDSVGGIQGQGTSEAFNLTSGCPVHQNLVESSQVPFKAGLAMLGFILLDVGYDGTCSFAKSYMVTCCPVSERTSLLVLCVIMASAGGLFSSVLGMMDMTSFPGLPVWRGYSGIVKIAVEAVSAMTCIAVGLPVTLLTGWALWKQTRPSGTVGDTTHSEAVCSGRPQRTQDDNVEETAVHLCCDDTSKALVTDDEERNSVNNNNNGALSLPKTTSVEKAFVGETNVLSFSDLTENDTSVIANKVTKATSNGRDIAGIKYTVEKAQPSSPHENEEILWLLKPQKGVMDLHTEEAGLGSRKEQSSANGSIFDYGTVKGRGDSQEVKHVDGSESPEMTSERKPTVTGKAKENPTRCQRGLKMKIGLLIMSSALSVGTAYMFSIGSSDYVAKAIYHGDPDAEPGTEGCRNEFLLAQFLTAGTMLCLALTARLGAFFVLAAVSGLHRVTFHVLPYTAATNILRAEEPESKRLGFVIALVTASIPLGNCVFFIWMGPLEHFTGVVSVPLWMGVFYGCMSALIFFLVGDVE